MSWWTVFFGILIFAFSPLIVLAITECFHKLDYVNESNSVLGALPWLLFFTVPIGAIAEVGWIIYGLAKYFWWAP